MVNTDIVKARMFDSLYFRNGYPQLVKSLLNHGLKKEKNAATASLGLVTRSSRRRRHSLQKGKGLKQPGFPERTESSTINGKPIYAFPQSKFACPDLGLGPTSVPSHVRTSPFSRPCLLSCWGSQSLPGAHTVGEIHFAPPKKPNEKIRVPNVNTVTNHGVNQGFISWCEGISAIQNMDPFTPTIRAGLPIKIHRIWPNYVKPNKF